MRVKSNEPIWISIFIGVILVKMSYLSYLLQKATDI